jgi:hypothetical protein
MICEGCAYKLENSPLQDEPFGSRPKCLNCNSLVKVVFNFERYDTYSPNKYADQEPNYLNIRKSQNQDFLLNSPNEEIKSPAQLNPSISPVIKKSQEKKTVTLNNKTKQGAHQIGPVIVNRAKLEKCSECDHHYCETCSVNLQNCMICKKKLVNVICSICNRGVALNKRGDFWECSFCNLLSLECFSCKTFGSALDISEKCTTCNCQKSSNDLCKVHQLCERCFKKMGNKCEICTKDSLKCKSCNTYDIMCFNSLCPYCYYKTKRPYCLSCHKT